MAMRDAVPPEILAKLRMLCLTLPGAYEEAGWVGVRWMVQSGRSRTFSPFATDALAPPPALPVATAHRW